MDRYAFIAIGYNDAVAYTGPMDPLGVILFAHGARDARWAEPFERLRKKVEAAVPGTPVALAYLEFMAPDLDAAVARLVAEGCQALRIVPIFLGQGGHVRQDLPALVARIEAAHPGVPVTLRIAVGEDERVLERIAEVCIDGLGPRP